MPFPNRSYAQSYGGHESGHKGTEQPNRSEHLEHPGPEAPASGSSSGGKGDSSGEMKNPEQHQTTASVESGQKKAGGAGPKLHDPGPPSEEQSDDVKQHNKEFGQRPDRASNRIADDEKKVEKGYWSGGK